MIKHKKIFTNIKRYLKIFINQKALILFVVAIIFGNICIRIENNKYNKFYKLNKKDIIVTVAIISEPEEKEYNYVYKVIGEQGVFKNKKILLYTNKKEKLNFGDLIKIKGDIENPSKKRNYKGFDYSNYLKTKKIYGIVKANKIQIIGYNKTNVILKYSHYIRNKIKSNIEKYLPKETASVLIALVIGEKNNISDETIRNFKNSSLYHILAISGMHISYIVLGVTYFLTVFKFSKNKINICASLFLIIFMFITEFSPSVVRASIMGILILLVNVFHCKNNFENSISVSLLIIILYNPFAIKDIGLILSYLATISIVWFGKLEIKVGVKRKYKKVILNIVLISIWAQILILPILIYNFNSISTIFIISNILASPILICIIIVAIIAIPTSFIFSFVSKIFFFVLNILIKILIFISKLIGNLPFSKITVITPSVTFIILYYIFVLLFYYLYIIKQRIKNNFVIRNYEKNICKYISKKILIKLLVLTTITIIISNLSTGILNTYKKELIINFIDVGQGDCSLIITPKGKNILIDGGDNKQSILLPYLLDKKINKIDYIIISHFDSDHCNGLIDVISSIKVGKVIITKQIQESQEYLNILDIIKKKKISIVCAKSGLKIQIEKNIYIDILYPCSNFKYNDLNNNSIVCKLYYNNFSVLFTGDIEEAEKDILSMYKGNKLSSNIIKISHHGSETSSSEEFLKAVNPKIALIGVGKNNKFGHPSNEIIERLKNINTKIYRTDENAEINLKITEKGKVNIKTLY